MVERVEHELYRNLVPCSAVAHRGHSAEEDGEAVICPYCGAPAEIRDDSLIYSRSYGRKVLVCTRWPECTAFVSCHSRNDEPMGTMADRNLRELRKALHERFDLLWTGPCGSRLRRGRERRAAYAWLAETLGITVDECHIAMFDADLCQRAMAATHGRTEIAPR